MRRLNPDTIDGIRSALAAAAAAGQTVRIAGGETKLHWGGHTGQFDAQLTTTGLDRVLEHNAGDLTAVLEAGVPLARAQTMFAAQGQMLAIDPYLGPAGEATVGGVIASADSGPLRHRYGAPRDLLLGMTVVLTDGTVARSGGKVIKNVAGYDLAKLFCGSLGTLGVIVTVNVRLHPVPQTTATAIGQVREANELAGAARALAAAALELEALDFLWGGGHGRILARCGGVRSASRAQRVSELMRAQGLGPVEVVEDDEGVWSAQRAAQRSGEHAVVRVVARPTRLAGILQACADCGARAVGRAALGISFITVEDGELEALLSRLPAEASWMLFDGPERVRARLEDWTSDVAPATLELMRRVKQRFDPTRTCNPGLLVGGI